MRTRTRLIALVAGLAACACQATAPSASPASPGAGGRAHATTSARPARSLIAVRDDAGAGRTALKLVGLDGSQVANVTLPPSESYRWPGVGGGMLTFVDGGQLKGLRPSGAVQTFGPSNFAGLPPRSFQTGETSRKLPVQA